MALFVELPVTTDWNAANARSVWVNADRVVLFDASYGTQGMTTLALHGRERSVTVALTPAEVLQRLQGTPA